MSEYTFGEAMEQRRESGLTHPAGIRVFLEINTHMADWFAGLPANHEVPSSRPALVAGSV